MADKNEFLSVGPVFSLVNFRNFCFNNICGLIQAGGPVQGGGNVKYKRKMALMPVINAGPGKDIMLLSTDNIHN